MKKSKELSTPNGSTKLKVTINLTTYDNVEKICFPDGYPGNKRFIWLIYPYQTTSFKRSDYLKIDYQTFEITNKTYIKIEIEKPTNAKL